MIKAIIFDWFGVLFPNTYWAIARKYAPDLLGRAQEFHDLLRRCDLGFIRKDELWDRLAEMLGISRAVIDEELIGLGGVDLQLLDYIKGLKRQYRIGLISNVGKGFLERAFENKDPHDYFDELILSTEEGVLKPDKRIYERAAERLGVKIDKCLFVDDSDRNVEGALAAGMKVIKYVHFGQAKQELEQLLADSDN